MLITKSRYLWLFNVFFLLTKHFIIFGKDADQGHRGLARTKDHILYTLIGKSAALKAKTLAEEYGFHFLNDKSIQPPTKSYLHDDGCPLFEFQPVTEKRVGKIIRSLPSNKAAGPDKVTAEVLKDSLPITIAEITNLVNSSFSSNKFAQVWKLAEVIPILKSGDPVKPSNTRPICLLPVLSKVCERAAHSQFVDFLDQNEKISKLLSGNRRFHTTETTQLYFTDEILKKMDDKKSIRDRPFRHV